MSVLILGSEGAQGKRYQSILRHLGEEYVCRDLQKKEVTWTQAARHVDRAIITTPTATHEAAIRECVAKLPKLRSLLVEKPIVKDPEVLDLILSVAGKRIEISMVHQYRQLVGRHVHGPTEYDYFRHGSDGLKWDCLQIIGLARGKIRLSEESPIWKCRINGVPLKIEDMDRAYILEIGAWLEGKGFSDPKKILKTHKKVAEFEL